MTGRIEIRFARKSDEQDIVEFLRAHWSKNHIFVTHPQLMRWQHESVDFSDGLNFVIARQARLDDSAGVMMGLLGFIPFRRFDHAADWSEVALAIWKVRDDTAAPGLGLQLLKMLQRAHSPALVCAIGISQVVKPIYTALGYKVDSLLHAALFAEAVPLAEHEIASGVPPSARRRIPHDPDVMLVPISGDELPDGISARDIESLSAGRLPRKSWSYMINRYVRHPYYDYQVRALLVDDVLRALLVWRKVGWHASSVLRIVDILGDARLLARCGAVLRRELGAANAQYIDVTCFGVEASTLAAGGFFSPSTCETLVLPSYFDPFERRNVPIEIAFRVAPEFADRAVQLFRADSDQDRPNSPRALEGGQ